MPHQRGEGEGIAQRGESEGTKGEEGREERKCSEAVSGVLLFVVFGGGW